MAGHFLLAGCVHISAVAVGEFCAIFQTLPICGSPSHLWGTVDADGNGDGNFVDIHPQRVGTQVLPDYDSPFLKTVKLLGNSIPVSSHQ
jgi:hypothetical protein